MGCFVLQFMLPILCTFPVNQSNAMIMLSLVYNSLALLVVSNAFSPTAYADANLSTNAANFSAPSKEMEL